MAERVAVGLDIGGTKIAGMLVADSGAVLQSSTAPTPVGAEETMETVLRVVEDLGGGRAVAAIGVGIAGMVEFPAGVLRSAPNLAWDDLPIRAVIEGKTGLPCLVDNDANAAGWGEFRHGASQGFRHVLTITVGTGIGGAIIADGALLRGAHGFGAEIGHIIVEPGGPACGCGNLGCWEQVASGRALDRLGADAARADPSAMIARLAAGSPVTGHHVVEAAKKGDEKAVGIIATVGRRLGEGIAGLVNVLDPEIVVVGGGAAAIGERLLGPARDAFRDAVEAPDRRPEVAIIPAMLGNDAGAIGAAVLALDEEGSR